MAAGLANVLPAPSVALVPRIEPYLVEVVVPFPLGFQNEAEALLSKTIADLLARPTLGEALATTPEPDEDSPRVATAAMVQSVARLVVQQAQELTAAAIVDMLTTPGKLRGMLPTEPPPDAGTPWLNKGLLAITPDAE